MSQYLKCCITIVLFIVGVANGNLRAEAPSGQVDAYVMVIKAEQAEKSGNLKEAVKHYREALELYKEVNDEHPDWRPELMRYRIADSINNIKRLERKVGIKEKKPVAEPAPEPAPAAEVKDDVAEKQIALLHEKEIALRKQNEQLKLRTEKLEEQIAQLADAAAIESSSEKKPSSRQVNKLNKEIEKLSSANTALTEDNVRMSSQIKELNATREDLLEAAKRDAVAFDKEIKQTVKEATAALKKEIDLLEGERDVLDKQLKGFEKAAAKEQARLIEPLEEQIADLKKEQADLERKLDKKIEKSDSQKYKDAASKAEAKYEELSDSYDVTLAELESVREELAAIAARSAAPVSGQEDIERLTKENEALKETIDFNSREMERIREYKKEIKSLQKANKDLGRDLEKTQAEMAKNDLTEEFARLTSQNDILVDEVQSFRKRLEESEKLVRKLERELSKK